MPGRVGESPDWLLLCWEWPAGGGGGGGGRGAMQATRCSYIAVHDTPKACLPLKGSDERAMEDGERMP